MSKWKKQVLKMKPDHGWRAKPGHKIFVADRGAVRFDYPQEWVVEPGEKSVKFYDVAPPDDNCRLEVSFMRLPPIDWSGLPLQQLVEVAVKGDERNPIAEEEMRYVKRADLELAWTEITFIDPVEKREARSRICVGRGSNIQPLITLDFWPEDAERVNPVWDEVLRSLELGQYIQDPTRGK